MNDGQQLAIQLLEAIEVHKRCMNELLDSLSKASHQLFDKHTRAGLINSNSENKNND